MADGIDLHTIRIVFAAVQGNILLHFRGKATARAAYDLLSTPEGDRIEVEDDFGNVALVNRPVIGLLLLSHLAEDLNAQRVTRLVIAHAEAKLQREAAADPMLRAVVAQPTNGSGLIMGRGVAPAGSSSVYSRRRTAPV